MFFSDHARKVRQLYKLILRLHRGLSADLRVLGDNYVREEFKRHKNCSPKVAGIFLNEWRDYVVCLAKQLKPLHQAKKKTVGQNLNAKVFNLMTEDQLYQLYELQKAIKNESS